ncbi:hypothetical protein Gpo141_00003233 [Globisporangium polare]
MRLYALQVLGNYRTTHSKETRPLIARQLFHALELIPKVVDSATGIDVEDQVIDDLVVELDAISTRDALERLRKEDALAKHIRFMTPADGEKCQRVPTCIAIHLDPLVTSVDTQEQVLKVTHGRGASVHGHVAFSSSDGVLTFTPTVAFEKKSRYLVKLRCAEVQTCLGGPAMAGGDASFHFSTT